MSQQPSSSYAFHRPVSFCLSVRLTLCLSLTALPLVAHIFYNAVTKHRAIPSHIYTTKGLKMTIRAGAPCSAACEENQSVYGSHLTECVKLTKLQGSRMNGIQIQRRETVFVLI